MWIKRKKKIAIGKKKKAQVLDETDVEGIVDDEVYPVIKDIIEKWEDEVPGELKEYYYEMLRDTFEFILEER